MVRIGDTRGGCWDGEQEREGECTEEGGVERERERERPDDGFTRCVSTAVETTGWVQAQHMRRGVCGGGAGAGRGVKLIGRIPSMRVIWGESGSNRRRHAH